MSLISENSIEDVKSAVVIEKLIADFVKLEKAGKDWKGCCPFHDEKSPSFVVSPAKGIYKCFGCGESGNGVDFLMKKKGLLFIDAIKALAERYKITLEMEATADAEYIARKSEFEKRSAVINTVHSHYRKALVQAPDIINYIKAKRKIGMNVILDFQLGYAPAEWEFISNKVRGTDYLGTAIDLAIINRKDGGSGLRDKFRHRVMFPICDRNGRILGFGGEKLPHNDEKLTGTAKYINSTESPNYFEKSKLLYGLHLALPGIRKQNAAVIVEGYYDVIGYHNVGITNAVGTMGTAFTDEQAQLLSKYTDKVFFCYDGDAAGKAATAKSIDIALAHKLTPYVVPLPKGMDPDDLAQLFAFCGWDTYNDVSPRVKWGNDYILSNANDGVIWKIDHIWAVWKEKNNNSEVSRLYAEAVKEIVTLISLEEDDTLRAEYIAHVKKNYAVDLGKQLKSKLQTLAKQTELSLEEKMPEWVKVDKLYSDGFVMNLTETSRDRIGIYFKSDSRPVIRLTNYVVKPLYLIMDPLNSRRLIEVNNGYKTAVVELPNKAFTGQDSFETEIISKGNFYSEPGFSKIHYKRIVNWLADNMPMVHELKTLGWQPEGFFAFSNKVVDGKDGSALGFDDYGIAKVNGATYLSPGASKINSDYRTEDNIYENDMYLSYKQSTITFKEWAELFCEVYDEHAPFAIAFLLIAAYKDIISRITKIPLAYFYGPKGSGKSAIAESMMWFFFSGLNADGKLIQGYNLNPGQGTPFSFFSRLQRFRNVFMLFNEYDPTTVEFWKKGAFKSSYDGEGREVGSGDTGKKRKTEIQKPQCVLGIAGQYLDTTDDGSVMSRSVIFKFSLEKNKARTDEQKAKWKQLNELEHSGISSLAADLYTHRDHVKQHLKDEFWKIESGLNAALRKKGAAVEARLLNNYSLCLAVIKVMAEKVDLPFSYEQFKVMAFNRIIEQSKLLRDNNIMNTFWNTIEVLFDDGFIKNGYHLLVRTETQYRVKDGSDTISKMLVKPTEILYIRMNSLHDKFSKRFREVHNKTAPDEDTIITYLKDQPYFMGLTPSIAFKDKKTSAYMVNYEELKMLGINLEKFSDEATQHEGTDHVSVDPTEAQGGKNENENPEDVPF